MKRIAFYFLLLSVTLFAVGCGDDDGAGGGGTSASVVGMWELTAFNGEGTISTTEGGMTTSGNFSNVGSNFNVNITFTENPNNFTSTGTYDAAFTITIDGNAFSYTSNIGDIFGTGTWAKSGDIMTITDDMGESFDAEILELTSNRMRVRAMINITETNGSETSVFEGTYNYTYER